MKDELTDNEHSEILKNEDTEKFGCIITFQEYTEIGYEADEALRMTGLTEKDIHIYPFLRLYYIKAKQKIEPNYKHKTFKI